MLGWRKKSEPAKHACEHRYSCAELNHIHHEVRNALLELHQRRRELLRSTTIANREALKAYEGMGEVLARIERALDNGRTPLPEDAIG